MHRWLLLGRVIMILVRQFLLLNGVWRENRKLVLQQEHWHSPKAACVVWSIAPSEYCVCINDKQYVWTFHVYILQVHRRELLDGENLVSFIPAFWRTCGLIKSMNPQCFSSNLQTHYLQLDKQLPYNIILSEMHNYIDNVCMPVPRCKQFLMPIKRSHHPTANLSYM